MRDVTSRYRWPFERATEPTLGSTMTSVSGESSSRSCSATTPSFIWSRTAIRASRDRADLQRRRRRKMTDEDPIPVGRLGGGWQVGRLYAGTPTPDVDPELASADPARRRRERGEELAGPKPQLLGDDRRVGLDVEREALQSDHAARPGRGRKAVRGGAHRRR